MPPTVPFYVSIPLVGRKSAEQWDHVSTRLQTCLQSYFRSTDPDFRIVISGHETPDIPELADPRVAFLEMGYPSNHFPPELYRRDKRAKRKNNLDWITERGGGDVFVADADDHIHRTLIERVRKANHPHGHVVERGLIVGLDARAVATIPGVYSSNFNRVCGTSSIFRVMGLDPGSKAWRLPLQNHAHVATYAAELGRPLNVIESDSVAYVIASLHTAALLNRRTESSVKKLQKRIRRRRLKLTSETIEGYHLEPLLGGRVSFSRWLRGKLRR